MIEATDAPARATASVRIRRSLARRRRRNPVDPERTFSFDSAGGPVVGFCGLAGGAGTTTLAWSLALAAARASSTPVMLAELPSASGGIAALTGGVAEARSLGRIVAATAAGNRPKLAPARGPDGLHLLASGPEPAPELAAAVRREALGGVLSDMRRAHGLVVLDCGVIHAPDARTATALCTHVVWTVPADRQGAERAIALLVESRLAPPPGDAGEILTVVATRPSALSRRANRALRSTAAERCDRLVLIPHARDLAGDQHDHAITKLSTSLAAIAGALRA